MALLTILHFPDPRLRTVAKAVATVDSSISTLVDDMFETMYTAAGIGLAATQVNIHQRIIVIDLAKQDEPQQPLCLINPQITHREGVHIGEEGCLSVPEIYDSVERAEKVTVTALNREGESITLEAEGLLAVCIQHEMDHLQGKLFVDYLSNLKRQRIRKKLEKRQPE
jgi:peptide deformylase